MANRRRVCSPLGYYWTLSRSLTNGAPILDQPRPLISYLLLLFSLSLSLATFASHPFTSPIVYLFSNRPSPSLTTLPANQPSLHTHYPCQPLLPVYLLSLHTYSLSPSLIPVLASLSMSHSVVGAESNATRATLDSGYSRDSSPRNER